VKFLVIDSSQKFSNALKTYFTKKDVDVDVEDAYASILENFKKINLHKYDAFVFSIENDERGGLDLIEYMKLINIGKPVVFISYERSLDLLSHAFSHGAEDYLSFPFEMKELELRVMKAIRRTIPKDEIRLPNDYSYVYTEKSIINGNLDVCLTKKQRELLYLLMSNKNSLVTYEMIQEYVYESKEFTYNAIATHVRDIKKKVTGIPIKSIKGEGYVLKI
jgi:DNA-binding response OmpR family regulator